MALKKWHELPVNLRRSAKDRWNYLVDELSGGTDNSQDEPQEEFTPVSYSFTSYSDAEGTTEWGSGTVETTGNVTDGYTQVEVKTNSPNESFVGQKFFITSDAEADNTTLYPLYSDAGETAVGIYVKISQDE